MAYVASKPQLNRKPSSQGRQCGLQEEPSIRTTPEIAVIRTVGHFKVQSVDDACRQLYQFAPTFAPDTLWDAVEDRAARGWFGIAELLDDRPPSKVRHSEIASAPALTTFQVSPSGDLIAASHVLAPNGQGALIAYTATGYSTTSPPSTQAGIEVLNWLHDFLAVETPLLGVLGQVDDPYTSSHGWKFIGDLNGNILFRDKPRASQDIVVPDNHLESMNLPIGSAMDSLKSKGHCTLVVDDLDLGTCLFTARRIEIFPDGPAFLTGSFTSISHLISPQAIRALYPSFTPQEAVVIAILSQGSTIKQAANSLGKSKVTLALQARSALNKTSCTSIDDLTSRIILTCASYAPR